MSDDQNNHVSYKVRLDRRDRLGYALCADEPSAVPAYQLILDEAYAHKNKKRRKLGKVYRLLMRNKRLPMSPYQGIRTEYLFAEYYRELDRELDNLGVPEVEREDDPLGQAADHYRRAAEIADEIADEALVAQLKALESRACYGSHPTRRRYRRAFETAKEALDAWIALPRRDVTSDISFGFNLGDAVGVRGQLVAEDAEAVRGLEYAAWMLHELRHRADANLAQYANDDLFLDWDWAVLYYSAGQHRLAFRKARATKKKGDALFTIQNRARFQCFVARIMLACVEEGEVGDYSRARLMAAASAALAEAKYWWQVGKDQGQEDRAAYAMILLAAAKWLALNNESDGRIPRIEEAGAIATARADILLMGQVETAWGDEFAFQHLARPTRKKLEAAEKHYRDAIAMFEDVEAFSLARVARLRLERLTRRPTRRPTRRRAASSRPAIAQPAPNMTPHMVPLR
ncbi:MAG TPA: hypothetical protein VJO13_19420 [Ktedonobacterales bacterium]|nr:hypothetical protein [Ktedonobacterales bacterium]